MKAFSSAVSITAHIGVVAAALFGSAKTGRSDAPRIAGPQLVLPPVQPERRSEGGGEPSGGLPITISLPDPGTIPLPAVPQTGEALQALAPTFSPSEGLPRRNAGTGWNPWRSEESAEVLSGPVPSYPDLLRQAGVEGKGSLAAVGDTTGRRVAQSIPW